MIQPNSLLQGDCLDIMRDIPDGSIDAVICDLPYGTMKGIVNAPGWENCSCEWDSIIPTDKLFAEYDRVLRTNGTAVLFSQEPYTSHLRTYPKKSNLRFCYPLIWRKGSAGNALMSYKAPVSVFEDMNVFIKRYDSNGTNLLREYFAAVLRFIGKPKRDIMQAIGQGADHVFRVDSTQWALCTADTYGDIIRQYGIDKMQGFRTYEDLQSEDIAFKEKYKRIFNLPEGKSQLLNVFDFNKDPREALHPTQKPVALIRRLVLTYTNEGDTVLDNCCGSGTTAIAAIREKRNYICIEKDPHFYEVARKRIDNELRQPTLF